MSQGYARSSNTPSVLLLSHHEELVQCWLSKPGLSLSRLGIKGLFR